ncbi:flagellar hook capping FlgD N-terminal domain-containing protein [Chryseomicrobium aureum]|uniref:flagellar hook capping FlgD N-terminal domain-containing protein n=1 Tax=Chryseomicrobium aureum TaxID=1441723 RepID=UPI00370D82BD
MNITTVNGTTTYQATDTKTSGAQGLGQDAFMKILIAQLRNQNPLEPMKDAEFIAQMAQFTSLEQLTALNKTMTSYTEKMSGGTMADYAEMIGKQISWKNADTSQVESGVVQSIVKDEGKFYATLVESDARIDLSTVTLLQAAPITDTTT